MSLALEVGKASGVGDAVTRETEHGKQRWLVSCVSELGEVIWRILLFLLLPPRGKVNISVASHVKLLRTGGARHGGT